MIIKKIKKTVVLQVKGCYKGTFKLIIEGMQWLFNFVAILTLINPCKISVEPFWGFFTSSHGGKKKSKTYIFQNY